MAGEDLLDQRRSGARNPVDEQRARRPRARRLQRFHRARREAGDQSVREPLERRRIERLRPSAQRRALRIERKGAIMIAAVVIGLGQPVEEACIDRGLGPGHLGSQPLHLRKVAVAGGEGLDRR